MECEAVADLSISFQRSHCFDERRIEAALGPRGALRRGRNRNRVMPWCGCQQVSQIGMNRDRDFLTRLVSPAPNFAVSDCRLGKCKHVTLTQARKHSERNRKSQLLGNTADHCSALIQGPWTIRRLGIPRSLDPLHS